MMWEQQVRTVGITEFFDIGQSPKKIVNPKYYTPLSHVKWVPCHHGMARTQAADGGDGLQLRKVAVNKLNKQSQTADKGWSLNLGIGREANSSSP
jgi:hypothetical protein